MANLSLDIVELLLSLVVAALWGLGWAKILVKAGFSRWMGLVMLVPIINFIVFLCLALMEWPLQVKLRAVTKQNPPTNA